MPGARHDLKGSGAESQLYDRLRTGIADGVNALSLSLSQAQQGQLVDYVVLLTKWNRAYNLTAVRDPDEMVARHLLDSLVALPELLGTRLADVGTGAGLPGIPLAIARPDIQFALIDSNGKKTRFLFEVQSRLNLKNISVHTVRVEKFHPISLFDMVLSRAYASLEEIAASTAHLLSPKGQLLAWKGQHPAEEIAQLDDTWQFTKLVAVNVPGVDAPRHLVTIGRVDAKGGR